MEWSLNRVAFGIGVKRHIHRIGDDSCANVDVLIFYRQFGCILDSLKESFHSGFGKLKHQVA